MCSPFCFACWLKNDRMSSMAGQCLHTSRLELYTVPRTFRSAYFKGQKLATLHSCRVGRHQRAVQVKAVVAPPKPSKDLAPFEAWNTGAVVKKRTDIKTILILGPGPIIIGQVIPQGSSPHCGTSTCEVIGFELYDALQACEFDYSGTQACKALRWGKSQTHCFSHPL
jgi:hypothetical protein